MANSDQDFVDFVVRAIVNNPNDVKSTRTVDERGVLITLDINASDMGYVIGRQGQTARSIRTLLKIVGAKNNASVNLKINEPAGGRPPRPQSQPFSSSFSSSASSSSPSSRYNDDVDTSVIDNLTI